MVIGISLALYKARIRTRPEVVSTQYRSIPKIYIINEMSHSEGNVRISLADLGTSPAHAPLMVLYPTKSFEL